MIQHSSGPGAGIFAGMDDSGNLFIRNLNESDSNLVASATSSSSPSSVRLKLEVVPNGPEYTLTLSKQEGEQIESLVLPEISSQLVAGNIALVASYGQTWFRDWSVSGTKLQTFQDRHAGPVLGTQYTLDDQILKMTAQLMPIGESDSKEARLEVMRDGAWREIATATIITPGYTAPFRVESWNSDEDVPYRVAYELRGSSSATQTYYWEGTVRQDPINQEVVSIAGFTGNHNTGRGVEGGSFRWIDRVWFPHTDIINHLEKQQVDVLFFSGDQVYEGASPTFPDKEYAYLDYLYKWYLWAWAFRDVTKDRPTITIPDDHDVYQGNIWGNGGRRHRQG